MTDVADPPGADDVRLESWKEVAAYLRRDVSTVQRWEKREGLPVHRQVHDKLGSVYAFKAELDTWRVSRKTHANSSADGPVPASTNTDQSAALEHAGLIGRRQPRWWVIGAASAVLVLVAVGIWGARRTPGAPVARIESIAILAFDNQGGADDRFLADGIADDIGRQLGHIGHVRILSRESVSRVQETDPRQLARRLHVQAVLSGSFRPSSTRFEVHVRLVDGQSGRDLASDDYVGQLRDIGGPRGPAAEIARVLQRRLWPGEDIAAVSERPQAAYLAYLRGRSLLSPRTEESLRAAITRFEQAVAAEPNFAEAYAGLADAHTLMGIFGFERTQVAWPKGEAAAREALRLDDRLAEAHTSLAFLLELWEHRWADAETSFKRAIALNPSYALAHHWYALLLDSTLRPDEALREIETAIALEPFSAAINSDLPMILAHDQRYGPAIEQFKKTIALYPTYAPAYNELGWTYVFAGRYDEALESFQRAKQLGTDSTTVLSGIAWLHAAAGRRALAEDAMREIERMFKSNPEFAARACAPVLLALGDKDKALDILVRTMPDGDPNILVGRQWDGVREDPRYMEILRRTGLSR